MTFPGDLLSQQYCSDSPEFPKEECPSETLGGDRTKRRSVEWIMSFDETGRRLLLLNKKVSGHVYFD